MDCESQVEVRPSASKSTQWDLQDSKSSGSSFFSHSETVSQATQVSELVPSNTTGSQTIEPYKVETGIQAFEHEPWEGLLSRQEVCELIDIDRFIGMGMRDQPGAEYDNHTVTCKRVMSQGVVYQVIIIKEQYLPQKHTVGTQEKATATVEIDEQDKIIDLTAGNQEEVNTTQEDIEIVQVIEKKEESKEKEEQPKKVVVKDEKPMTDLKLEEEILTFKEKPWANLRQKMVGMQRNQTPIEVPDDRTPYQRRTESPAEPELCLLEINDHIRRAMEEIDEFLRNKPRDTQAFLPLA